MKKFICFLFGIIFTPSVAFADAADFNEIDYVFRSFESDVSAGVQDCIDIGVPFYPTSVANYDLYSLQSKKTSGRVLKDNIKSIGRVLTCVDASALSLEDPWVLLPAYFKVTLDGMTLIVEGHGRYRSLDIPEPYLGMTTFSLKIVEGPPEIVGGWLVTNTLSNVFGLPGYVNGSFATVRLFTPAVSKNNKR